MQGETNMEIIFFIFFRHRSFAPAFLNQICFTYYCQHQWRSRLITAQVTPE